MNILKKYILRVISFFGSINIQFSPLKFKLEVPNLYITTEDVNYAVKKKFHRKYTNSIGRTTHPIVNHVSSYN